MSPYAIAPQSDTSSITRILSVCLTILAIGLVVIIYIIPIIVANKRKHPNKLAITVLNIFLGWSFIGWIVALVWACTTNQNNESDIH